MKKNLLNLKIAALTVGMFATVSMSAQFTAVTSGDWSNSATWGGTGPGSTVSNQNVTIASGVTVNMDQDVTFSGLLNSVVVNGVLTNTTSNWMHMSSGSLAGTGTVSINKLRLSSLAGVAFGGTMNLKNMSTSVASLAFTSVANITDTLELENGNLNLNTNGNLTMMTGSTVKVKDGSIVINSGVFNSGNAYNVMYVGSSKTTGSEFNTSTVQNLYINMSASNQNVKLGSNAVVNGTINGMSGMLDINGKKLTLKGDVSMNSGSFIDSDNSSQLWIEGTGAMSGNLIFAPSASMGTLTINRTTGGQVKLGSTLNIASMLNLMEGSLNIENTTSLSISNSGTIHVEKGILTATGGTFIGSSIYDVHYTGNTDVTAGLELSGSGLNNVMINYLANTNKVKLSGTTDVNGKLTLMKGKLDLNGKSLMLSGTLDQTTDGRFVGGTSSELDLKLTTVAQHTVWFDETDAAGHTLNTLKINTTGSGWVVLGNKLMVSNSMQFITGKLELGNGDLELMPTASMSGYDDNKYVVTTENNSGVLIQNVNTGAAYVTFPIGTHSNYSPAYVQQTSAGTTGNFSAKCYSVNTYAVKSVDRIWNVSGAGVTSINANVKFGWKAASETNGFDRTNAYVSHYTNSMWDVNTAGAATAGVNNTFELSRTGLTSLSPFAVVENGQVVGIKENTQVSGTIEIYPNPSKDVLNIQTLSAGDSYNYALIDVTGRTVLSANNVNGPAKFNVSDLNSGCYFVKVTNLTNNKTETKRFIKQ